MLEIKIPDMMCAHCEDAVRKAITETGGNVMSLDLSTKIVKIETQLTRKKLAKLLSEVGFDIEFLS